MRSPHSSGWIASRKTLPGNRCNSSTKPASGEFLIASLASANSCSHSSKILGRFCGTNQRDALLVARVLWNSRTRHVALLSCLADPRTRVQVHNPPDILMKLYRREMGIAAAEQMERLVKVALTS